MKTDINFDDWWSIERLEAFWENFNYDNSLAIKILAKDAWQAGYDTCKLSNEVQTLTNEAHMQENG